MQLWQAGPNTYLLRGPDALESGSQPTYILGPQGVAAAKAMARVHAAVQGSSSSSGSDLVANGTTTAGRQTVPNHFDSKTDHGSADLYFHY